MKIIKETSTLMVIKEKDFWVLLVGIAFALVGFLMIWNPALFTEQPPLWFGFVFFVIGCLVIFNARETTITLDKTANKLIFEWKFLLRRNKNFKEYDLNQIKEIELEAVYDSSKNRRIFYKLVFVLNTDEKIDFSQTMSTMTGFGRQIINKKREIGIRVANFLNIPFQERRPPTVREILSTVQEVIQKEIEKYNKE
jgi:hypothetical protein